MGRIAIREGVAGAEPADFHVASALPGEATEAGVRAAFVAALAAAAAQGARVVASPALGAEVLGQQRSAEILLDEARRHFSTPTCVEEIRFVVSGEPAFRVFESVQDAARIAEQMERLRRG
jgi:O-acetyl-ADP-ribose deacetylase (regulator of RNase III)